MKKLLLIFAMNISALSLQAQTEQTYTTMFDSVSAEDIIPVPKHEIGFSVGAFPLINARPPAEMDNFLSALPKYGFEHKSYREYEDGSYEKMYHFGSYSFNYNYNFNSKRSLGVSLSWLGRHIEKYEWFESDTINGSGWEHYFTLHGNYRYTYYRKNKVSLYWGIHFGATLCLRDKDILYKETYDLGGLFTEIVSNDRYFFDFAIHLNAFGINIGEKHIFNMELGLGTLGTLRAGYKYKI